MLLGVRKYRDAYIIEDNTAKLLHQAINRVARRTKKSLFYCVIAHMIQIAVKRFRLWGQGEPLCQKIHFHIVL